MNINAFGIKKVFREDANGKPILDTRGKKIPIGEEYFINPLSEHVKPYVLIPRNADLNPTNPEQIVVPVSGQSADVTLGMSDEGIFEGAYLTARFLSLDNADMLFELIDTQRRISLTGRPCHVNTVIGTGQRPFILPESIVVDKRQELLVRFYNLSDQENHVRFQLHGQRINSEKARSPVLDAYISRRHERNRNMSVYMCPLDKDPVIAGATTSEFYFTNDHNIHFEVRKVAIWGGSADLKFRVIDEQGNTMSNGWVNIPGAMGSSEYPFIYYSLWMIEPGGKVRFQIANSSGIAIKVYITLSGRQHFVYPGSR